MNLVAGQRLFADFGNVLVVDVSTNVNWPRKPTILNVNCNRNTISNENCNHPPHSRST